MTFVKKEWILSKIFSKSIEMMKWSKDFLRLFILTFIKKLFYSLLSPFCCFFIEFGIRTSYVEFISFTIFWQIEKNWEVLLFLLSHSGRVLWWIHLDLGSLFISLVILASLIFHLWLLACVYTFFQTKAFSIFHEFGLVVANSFSLFLSWGINLFLNYNRLDGYHGLCW